MNEAIHIPRMETIANTASLFGVSQYFVRKLAVRGEINAVRLAGRILINCDKFAEYLNSTTLVEKPAEHAAHGIRPLK